MQLNMPFAFKTFTPYSKPVLLSVDNNGGDVVVKIVLHVVRNSHVCSSVSRVGSVALLYVCSLSYRFRGYVMEQVLWSSPVRPPSPDTD